MAKKDEYINYSDAIKAHKDRQQQEKPLFTEEELRVLAPHNSTSHAPVKKSARRVRKKAATRKEFTETPLGLTVAFIGCALFIGYIASGYFFPEKKITPTNTPRELTKQEKIDRQFSGWDGSHYDLVRRIKSVMHDPSSFEHVSTKFAEKDGFLMVTMVYRGNNAFGAKIRSTELAFYNIDGVYQGKISN